MQNYKIKWRIRSPLQTPLESDTIFGHICWAIKYFEGEKKLTEFLSEVERGRFLLSSAFPEGLLTIPNLPETSENLERVFAIHKENNDDSLSLYSRRKRLKKIIFVPVDIWEEINGSYTPASCYDKILSKEEAFDKVNSQSVTNIRNKVNRLTGTTGDGNLFAERLSFYPEDTIFDSYLKTDLMDIEKIKLLFGYISKTGFGKKKSIGRGYFQITVEPYEFKTPKKINSHLVLSNMIPHEDDSLDAYWNGKTKYAKVGGEFAVSSAPFKYPFYHFVPGSVFLGDQNPKGTLLKNIHPDRPEIRQNMLCYSIPFYWEGKND